MSGIRFTPVNRASETKKIRFTAVNSAFYIPKIEFTAVNGIFQTTEGEFTGVNACRFRFLITFANGDNQYSTLLKLQQMGTIKIKNELSDWLVKYITDCIHNMEAKDFNEFNKWAKSFKEEEAAFLVKAEFINDWGYDERDEITQTEAQEYAQILIQRILDNWYL